MKENKEKDVRLLSRTSIYLSQSKTKKKEEKKQPARKHRLPSVSNDLTNKHFTIDNKMKLNKKMIIPILLSIISLTGFIVFLILVANNHVFKIDNFNEILFNVRNGFLNVLLKILTYFGSAVVLFASALLILIFVKNRRVGFGLLGGLTAASLLNLIVKYIVKRPRPTLPMVVKEIGYSFPSAHAMLSLVFFGLLIYFVLKYSNKKWLKITLTILFSLIVVVVGFSRVYLGVHYLSDILAGYLVGLPIVFATIFVLQNFKVKK